METKSTGVISPARIAALEKIPAAAHRMGISTAQFYREAKAGRVGPIVKLGERASAIPAASVDAWIEGKIDAANAAQSSSKGGHHDAR